MPYTMQQPYAGSVPVEVSHLVELGPLTPQMFGANDRGGYHDTAKTQPIDNSAAFTAMFAAACLYGREVYIPPGEWFFSGVDITAPIHVRGAGRELTKLYLLGFSNRSAFRVLPYAHFKAFQHTYMSDFSLDGNGGYQGGVSHGIELPSAVGISLYAPSVQLRNLQVESFLNNCLYIGGLRNAGSTERCIFAHSKQAVIYSEGYDWKHDNLDVSANGDDTNVGIHMVAGGNVYFNFSNVYNGRHSVQIERWVNAPVFFQNSYFDFSTREGLVVDGTDQPDQQVVIVGGRFYGNSLFAPDQPGYFPGIGAAASFAALKLINTSHVTVIGTQISHANDDRRGWTNPGPLLKGLTSYQVEFVGSCKPIIFQPQSLPADTANSGGTPYPRSYAIAITNDFTKLGFAGSRNAYIGPFAGDGTISTVINGQEVSRSDTYKTTFFKEVHSARPFVLPTVTLADLQGPNGSMRASLYAGGGYAWANLYGVGPVWTEGTAWLKFSDNSIVA